jgi:hypothetical protein
MTDSGYKPKYDCSFIFNNDQFNKHMDDCIDNNVKEVFNSTKVDIESDENGQLSMYLWVSGDFHTVDDDGVEDSMHRNINLSEAMTTCFRNLDDYCGYEDDACVKKLRSSFIDNLELLAAKLRTQL